MTFPKTNLYGVYKTLEKRKGELGGIELIEFDDEEYKTLLRLGRKIVNQGISTKQNRLIFLALAIAHVRRYNLTTEDAFWNKFEQALGLAENENRLFITEDLLWKAYSDESIEKKRGEQTRRFVGTLLRIALEDSRLHRHQLLSFFEWYYETGPDRTIDEDLVRQYEQEKDTELHLFDASLRGLERHCNVLCDALDFAIEEELFLRDVDYDTYLEQIRKELGDKYDFDRYHLLSNPDALEQVVIRLENHRTPRQFQRELETFSPTASVHCPDRRKRRVRSPFFDSSDFPYGRYVVEDTKYRVVPKPWIRLRSIRNWEVEKIVSLRRSGYLGYCKDEPFSVRRGRRRESSRPCHFSRFKKTHVWAGPVEPGKPLVIDGNPVDASIGISPLSVDVQFGRNEEDESVMRFVVPSLDAFCPNYPGRELTLIYHDQQYSFTLDGEGTRSLRRAASFIVDPNETEAKFRLLRDGEQVDGKIKTLEASYLFSAISYGRIPAGTERKWGDRHYYLFTRHPQDLETRKGIEVEQLDVGFGTYSIFEIHWSDPDKPFFLKCRDRTWAFERSRYFLVQCHTIQQDTGPFELQPNQVCSLRDIRLDIQTNLPPDEIDIGVEVSIGEEHEKLGEFDLNRTDRVTHGQLRELDERRGNRTGPVEFYFYADDHLIETQSLAVLPKVRLDASSSLHTLRHVGERFPVRIRADGPILWNQSTGASTAALTVHCTPTVNLKASEEHPSGIHDRVPAPIRKRLYLPPLDEAIHLRFTPSICDVWTFEKSGNQYQEVRAFNYYQLADSALLTLSAPQTRVRLLAKNGSSFVEMRDMETNDQGSLLIEDLSFLASRCDSEHSEFLLESRSCQIPLVVRWAPRLHNSHTEGATVKANASGPSDTELIVTWKSGDEILAEQVSRCQGDRFSETYTTEDADSASEVLLQFRYAGGEKRTAKRYRLSMDDTLHKVPRTWFERGIGISDSGLFSTS